MMRLGAVFGVLLTTTAPVWAQSANQTDENAPLSAIDWLSESVEQPQVVAAAPVPGTQATRTPDANEDPVTNSATTPSVSVQPLGGPAPRALGLFPPAVIGLPENLWSGSDGAILGALLAAEETDTLPALQDLIVLLSISQSNPPLEAATPGAFFLTRVDKLLSIGALEHAQAMLEAATPDTSPLYQRWFDVSLLTGTEDAACRSLRDKPDVAPTPSARIFCLARSGDWSAAALTLNTGLALGDIDEDTGDLLARFLDPDLYEGEPDLIPPARATPLTFRMFEAIGAAQSTRNLPSAFSHSDLRPNVGWKAQLEAAERLARDGAISFGVLYSLYTARVPAASGGVWERAKAVRRLDSAFASGDADQIQSALDILWAEAAPMGILVPLAKNYGPQLQNADLPATRSVLRWMLLSGDYELAALRDDFVDLDPFLTSVARGTPSDDTSALAGAARVRDAFAADPDPTLIAMSANGRTGEAVLRTIATVQQGIDGDSMAFVEGIATLRALGLEDVARRVSLQYLLLR
ncbi:hypothetical protein L0664_05750 [Octadecabacter sp. G9-8]|uniref:Uncharacterized protein n=1 Tax=Octadecabacter dasysiphoniae TaxID=2909341 RepID=A0ABS9CUX5_9RHOB|nr:hypothetical protein [Octadecabacter dasysiphoniae]MCF2870562.1 hypothetical protein [Octadecabacter dasysiphoniae]